MARAHSRIATTSKLSGKEVGVDERLVERSVEFNLIVPPELGGKKINNTFQRIARATCVMSD